MGTNRKKRKVVSKVNSTKTVEQAVSMAIEYHQQGNLSVAKTIYRQILQIQPDNIDALHLLGVANTQTGQHEEAVNLIKQAIKINPLIATFYSHLGNALQNAERYDEAIEAYETALRIEPDLVDLYTNLGALFHKVENYSEAANYYQQALKFNSASPELYHNLAVVLSEEKRYEEAISYLQKTIQLNPRFADAYVGLGNALLHCNFNKQTVKQAISYYQKALQLNPTLYTAYVGLGNTTYHQQPEQGMFYFQKALMLNQESDSVKYARSYALLNMQRFTEGWSGYAARPGRRRYLLVAKLPNLSKELSLLPIDLTNQRFLLHKEQGLGDQLLFLRFIPLLKQRGAWITYKSSDKLYSLLSRQIAIDQLLSENDPLPIVDHTLLIGDLPYVLNTKELLPPSLLLAPLPTVLDKIQQRLITIGNPPYIGITWRGGITSQETRWTQRALSKEIGLTELATALKPVDATFIALQRKPFPNEIEQLSQLLEKPVHDFSFINDDLEDALAILALLDDYVGVSNTNMHLIAGLGKTAKVLIPYPYEWRWTLSIGESPWFKGFKTYRQTCDQDWSNALHMLQADLLK